MFTFFFASRVFTQGLQTFFKVAVFKKIYNREPKHQRPQQIFPLHLTVQANLQGYHSSPTSTVAVITRPSLREANSPNTTSNAGPPPPSQSPPPPNLLAPLQSYPISHRISRRNLATSHFTVAYQKKRLCPALHNSQGRPYLPREALRASVQNQTSRICRHCGAWSSLINPWL